MIFLGQNRTWSAILEIKLEMLDKILAKNGRKFARKAIREHHVQASVALNKILRESFFF